MTTSNLTLHRHVWLPKEGAVRTVVTLHGTGGDEHDMVPLVEGVYPDANILGIRGNVNENGYARFFKRYAEGMFDEVDIRARANELVAFFEAAVREYRIVPGATTWLGYSNGANMIAALLMLDNVVRDAVLLRAQYPLKAADGKGGATVKLLSGEYDTIVPLAESKKLRDALLAMGHKVEQVMVPTGHQLSHMDIETLKAKQ
jgi:phospholipase/carboxylesterase